MEETKQQKTHDTSTWTTLKTIITEHFLSSTAHAFPNIFRTSNIVLKFIWIACLLASTAICMKSVIVSLQDFLTYPSYISTTIIQEIPAKFPAVTFCNSKAIHKTSAFASSYLNSPSYLYQSQVFNYNNPFAYVITQRYTAQTIINNDRNLTETDRKNLGYDINYMLLSCVFNYEICDSSNFTYVYNPIYGNCYTFNKGRDNNGSIKDIKEISFSGPFYGLLVEFFVGPPLQNETFGEFNNGLLIFVHNQTSEPFFGNRIMAGTGGDTDVSVSRNFVTKLEKPHGDCLLDKSKDSKFSSSVFDYMVRSQGIEYSQRYCLDLCVQRGTIEKCNCSNVFLPLFNDSSYICLQVDEQLCLYEFVIYFGSNKNQIDDCNKQCPYECNSIEYDIATTKASYPTRYHKELLFNLTDISTKGVTIDNVQDSLAKVNVFYKSLEYKLVEQKIQMSTENFFSNIGGTLGLYIGISFLSLIELVELLFNIVLSIVTIQRKTT